jgi:hypothetical protein
MCHACMYSKLLIALTIVIFYTIFFDLLSCGWRLQAQIEGSDWRVPQRAKFNHANTI